MNRPLTDKRHKWREYFGIPFATQDFLNSKYHDHRAYTIRMLWVSSAVASGLWIWDYVLDPVHAPGTWFYRILMGLPFALCALYIMFLRPSRRFSQWIIIIANLLSIAAFFGVTTILDNGMLCGNEGYMLYQISVLLIVQASSFPVIVTGHITNTMIPHLLGYVFPDTGFLHVKYGILLWPVTIAALIAEFYMYIQYGRNWHLRQRLEEMASHDTLTGFLNRRAFIEHAGHLITLAKRHWHQHLAVLMIDADYFKQVNDSYGHDTGDRVLRELSSTLSHNLRSTDLQCRWGGEEFIILMPDTDAAGAWKISQRLLTAVRNLQVDTGQDEPLSITVSIGIADLKDSSEGLDSLISRADDLLYKAKARGRDRAER